jgi:DNA polymerase elongation subunit (family B)
MLPEIQYLVERYHSIKDEDIKTPKLKKFVIDIETISEEGFPEPEEAKWPINLISLYDIDTNEIFTFGEQPYTKTTLENENVQYYHAQDEQDLLQTFIDFFRNSGVDVVTG